MHRVTHIGSVVVMRTLDAGFEQWCPWKYFSIAFYCYLLLATCYLLVLLLKYVAHLGPPKGLQNLHWETKPGDHNLLLRPVWVKMGIEEDPHGTLLGNHCGSSRGLGHLL